MAEGHVVTCRKQKRQALKELSEKLCKGRARRDLSLIWEAKRMLDAEYAPDGYNVGVNCGIVSEQAILHVHVHLIPRYAGTW
jgi:diadenosine tetraphosphate (Ap4A) HIT family hydrolase